MAAFPAQRAFLDAASGPLHPLAAQTMTAAVDAGWADPRRLYREGRQAAALLNQARETIAADLGVRPSELSFHLGGGPAALTAALEGLAWPRRRAGSRLVASAVEHSNVLLAGRYAVAQSGDPLRFAEIGVDRAGRVDLDAFAAALTDPTTAVAALQHANGEVGTMQPVDAAYRACAERGIPLLVDGQASVGRVRAPASYAALVADAATVAGPPLGLLVVPERTAFRRPGPPREAEFGRADAPVWVPLALAAAEAWQQAAAVRDDDAGSARALTDRLRAAAAAIPDVEVAGDDGERLPHIVTCSALYVDGETLVGELDRRDIAVASGSACTASTLEPSHVLAAMGLLTHGNIRITVPWRATAPDRDSGVDRLITALPLVIGEVRARLGAGGL